MNPDQQVTITLQGVGLSYKGEVSFGTAVRIISLCASPSGGSDASQVDMAGQIENRTSEIRESVAEYLVRVGASKNAQKILAFANYQKEYAQKPNVPPEEVKLMFREAGEMLPANFSRDFKDATASGWLAQEPQKKGYYYVTRTGNDLLSKCFDGVKLKRSKKPANGKKPATQAADDILAEV